MFAVCDRCFDIHSQTAINEFVREARLIRAARERLSKYIQSEGLQDANQE